jgi:hypothetical protein
MHMTVEDVLPTLKSPESYIRGIARRLGECTAKHGNAYVRLGTSERGSIPDYRIFYRSEAELHEFVFGSFYGDDHSMIKALAASDGKWNSAVMTGEEIQNVLGKVSGWKGRNR